MKKIIVLLFCIPFFSLAQQVKPYFQNDTLYTSSGFKIYKGQTLQIGKGTGRNGKFRFINIQGNYSSETIADKTIVVKKLKNFGISVLDNGYISIIGNIVFKDGSKGLIDLHVAFDRAIENSLSLPSEIIVPDENRGKQLGSVAKEIEKLNKLYKDSVLTKEEFETQKKKLLRQ